MRILFVSEYYPPSTKGGGELSCQSLAEALAKGGTEIIVLTSRSKNAPMRETKKNLTIIREVSSGAHPGSFWSNVYRELFFASKLRTSIERTVAKYAPDLVHYFNTTSILGRPELKIPQIMHINSPVPFCPKGTLMYKDEIECTKLCTYDLFDHCFNRSTEIGKMDIATWMKHNLPLKKWIYRSFKNKLRILRTFDHYIAASHYMKSRLEREKIDPKKISIVPNIIDIRHYAPKKERKIQRPTKVLYLGHLSRNKGILVLLQALQDIRLPYTCTIQGNGPLRQVIVDRIYRHNLHVKLKDPVAAKQVPAILFKHDIIVFPSLIPEGFGRVVIEAQAAGKAVIASDSGALPELVKQGRTGLTVKAGDAKSLQTAIEKLISNPTLRQDLQKKAISDAGRYSSKLVVKKLMKVYSFLLSS